MKHFFLFFICILYYFGGKSQVLNAATEKAFQKYFFIPVQFDHFGKWINAIQKDSTIEFTYKTLNIENDSLYLRYEMKKPGFGKIFNDAIPTIALYGWSRLATPLPKVTSSFQTFHFESGRPRMVTIVTMSCIIPFDSTADGKRLAKQKQSELEKEFSPYFKFKTVKKRKGKNRKYYPEVERLVEYRQKQNMPSVSSVYHAFRNHQNLVYINLIYEITNQ